MNELSVHASTGGPDGRQEPWFSSLIIVDNFDAVSVAAAKLETDTPSCIYGHCPLAFASTLQLVQPDASKRTEVVQRLGGVQSQQQIDRHLKVEAAKLERAERADEDGTPTGSVAELQEELTRQEASIEKLRQRKLAIEATLETTNTQIRAAELRARLIAESLSNGGKLMNQAGLQEARKRGL